MSLDATDDGCDDGEGVMFEREICDNACKDIKLQGWNLADKVRFLHV